MNTHFFGTSYVALYLGVTPTSVHHWLEDPTFPQPEAVIHDMAEKVTSRGWSTHQLPELRDWRTFKLGLEEEEASAHWLLVDRDVANQRRCKRDHVTKDQLTFEIKGLAA